MITDGDPFTWYEHDECGLVSGVRPRSIPTDNEFAAMDRVVAKTKVGPVGVSTVFLGLDHGVYRRSFEFHVGESRPRPVLWETMIFGGEYDGYQKRYTSKKEAQTGHGDWVSALREGREPE